jgi:murein DD-endopeptidase MepM/ murein hydrolase activator NlpD
MAIINKNFYFKDEEERHPALRWLVFAVSSVVIGAVIANTNISSEPETTASEEWQAIDSNSINLIDQSSQQDRIARQSFELPLPELQAQQEILDDLNNIDSKQWREFKVRSGDSMAKLFKRADIKPSQLAAVMESGKQAKQLRKIFPGDIIRVLTDEDGKLSALRYEINHKSYLMVRRNNDQLESNIYKYKIETRTTHASGEIDSSLFLAAQRAGISQNTIMELAGIFGWDIDFVLDIRKGDRFTFIYEELFRNGEKIGDGNILTAEFINNKKAYRAIRYTNPKTKQEEYYTEDGKSMRKAFLRSPVKFSRISSKFTTSRYHPVLHKFRSHKGVDYAAKRGTPIRASGDGKVIYKGRKGGYGRVVIIQHGSKYTTLYAHLNSYNKKIRVGKKVKQGQTVAYVGSSGLATGAHLHYEFRLNGVHRNPLTVRLPIAKPVPKKYIADFKSSTAPLFAKLDLLTRTQLALNE